MIKHSDNALRATVRTAFRKDTHDGQRQAAINALTKFADGDEGAIAEPNPYEEEKRQAMARLDNLAKKLRAALYDISMAGMDNPIDVKIDLESLNTVEKRVDKLSEVALYFVEKPRQNSSGWSVDEIRWLSRLIMKKGMIADAPQSGLEELARAMGEKFPDGRDYNWNGIRKQWRLLVNGHACEKSKQIEPAPWTREERQFVEKHVNLSRNELRQLMQAEFPARREYTDGCIDGAKRRAQMAIRAANPSAAIHRSRGGKRTKQSPKCSNA